MTTDPFDKLRAGRRPPTAAALDFCLLDEHGHCITCSDEALPARVFEVASTQTMAWVKVSGQTTEVDVSLVDDVAIGHLLLVHGGVAIAHLGSIQEKR